MDIEAVIQNLIRATKTGQIEWRRRVDSSFLHGTHELADVYFTTYYNGHQLRLYRVKYPVHDDGEVTLWAKSTRLEAIDKHQTVLWEFPASEWTADLLEAATYHAAGVDTMISDLLREPDPD